MAEKITLACGNPKCGQKFRLTAPEKPGKYAVNCPHCKAKCHFEVSAPEPPADAPASPAPTPAPTPTPPAPNPPQQPLGFLDNGGYRYVCTNSSCNKTILVPANMVKIGLNQQVCPKCGTVHEFFRQPTQEELLKCQTADCPCSLTLPDPPPGCHKPADGIYSVQCAGCHAEYSVTVTAGEIVKVTKKTEASIKPINSTRVSMKLSVSSWFSKKEYNLERGTHYIGRDDAQEPSDFMVKDKYASARSLRIEVNLNGEEMMYKLTVIRASNPVYHNHKRLYEGDIIYLTYDDIIQIGETKIKVKKA